MKGEFCGVHDREKKIMRCRQRKAENSYHSPGKRRSMLLLTGQERAGGMSSLKLTSCKARIAGVQEGTPNGVLEMNTYGFSSSWCTSSITEGPCPPPAAFIAAITASVSGAGGVDWPGGVLVTTSG